MSLNLQPGTFGVFPAYIAKGMDVYEQVVLTWLWFYKNNEGKAFPSLTTLCERTCMSRQKMVEVLASLERQELLTRRKSKKSNGENAVNVYEMHCPEAMWKTQGENSVVSTVDHVVHVVDHGVVSTADCINTISLSKPINNATEVADINSVLNAFKKNLNPYIRYNNKTERKAALELIQEMGLPQVLEHIKDAERFSEDEFAPRITTPYELKTKLAKLILHKKKNSPKTATERKLTEKQQKEMNEYGFLTTN